MDINHLAHKSANEHRELEALLGCLGEMVNYPGDKEASHLTLSKLISLVIKHAHDEEQLMRRIDFKDSAANITDHQRVTECFSKHLVNSEDFSQETWAAVVKDLQSAFETHLIIFDQPLAQELHVATNAIRSALL